VQAHCAGSVEVQVSPPAPVQRALQHGTSAEHGAESEAHAGTSQKHVLLPSHGERCSKVSLM
jgi:hypothetical protein